MAELHLAVLGTPLGDMLAGSATVETPAGPGESLCLLEFHDRRSLPTERLELERHFKVRWTQPGEPTALLGRVGAELSEYFAGMRKDFDLPLVTPGSPFQQRVWFHLRRIACGATITYAELAKRVESPGGSRAVGQANGRNRIAIVVPCHRVIDSGGGLGGYGGKLWRKEKLLELEGALAPQLLAR
jgi:AraC family transcriptional regulator of adaptative response/methylated-DNA-[protein]-cysteine methyltransferase